jgi:hypothetical protein
MALAISRIKFFAIALLLSVAFQSRSQTDQTARSVVERYCQLDSQGANFSASNPNAKAIYQLLINEDEAGYDESVIVRSYTVGKAKVEQSSADVEVIYADLGTLGGELQVTKGLRSETVMFHLSKSNGLWKIDGLRMPPHISQVWILSHLQQDLGKDRQAAKRDPRLEAAIAAINQW